MDKLTTSLQESVLTLIVMDDEKGGVAAGLVDVDLFEHPYDEIVKKAIAFRKKFKRAPGNTHIDDLFDHILSNKKHRDHLLYQQVLGSILDASKGLNADYVLSRVSDFMDQQNVYAGIVEAADRYQRGGDGFLDETKRILRSTLTFKPDSLQKGFYLSDPRNIEMLTSSTGCDYMLGINEFDRIGFGLSKGRAFGFTAPQGRGKTWSCIHVGIMCILQGAKVLHISLEMDEQLVMPRYLRRLFAVAKRREKYRETRFELDDLKRVIGFDSKLITPKLTLEDRGIEKKIAAKMELLGGKLKRLHFKAVPTKRLTMAGLNAYMDQLEQTDGFMPDVLILDYPKLMKLPRADQLRIALGEQMEELRGLCGERKIAGYFPFQSNREGESTKLITAKHIGEDYSLTQTVDDHVTYNQTSAEEELGLARLYVDKARGEKKHYTVLITQDYETGQFVRQSAFMPNTFWEMVKSKTGKDGTDDEEEDEDRGKAGNGKSSRSLRRGR